jgi:methyltransferase (TIGR00027 family)
LFSVPPASIDPISYTARIVAAKRAIEQTNPNPLFGDPYAAALAGDEVENLLTKWREVAHKQNRVLEDVILKRTRYIAIRTRYFDDLLQSNLSRLAQTQVVILGSGLDTRAYRFQWLSETHVFEVDLPGVLNYKTEVLQQVSPTCNHYLIAGDLENLQTGWVKGLLEVGLDTDNPTIWLLEGVSMYLPESAVRSLLRTISALSSPGSVLGIDGVTSGSIAAAQRARKADRGRVIRNWQFGCDDPQKLLKNHGWNAEVSQPQDIGKAYGRYPQSIPVDAEIGGQQENRGVWLAKARKVS